MSRFLVAMFVGATIAAAVSTSASAWHCLASSSQRSIGHGLRRHTGKGPVNLNAPVHTPRRWGWLPNRMVPAVLGFSLSHAGSARRLLVGTPPSRPPGGGCAVVGLALGFSLAI